MLNDPVVEGAVGLILQRAQAVGDALQGVLDGMGEVVHGENAPLGALAVVLNVADAVDDGVPHIEVAGGHVDLGPEGILALGELAVLHPLEQVQALLDGAVPPGGFAGHADAAPVLLKLLGRQLADVGKALLDEANGQLVSLFKIVGAVEHPVIPVKAKPVDVLLNSIHELRILLGGVGIVKPEVAQAAELFSRAEVDGQGLAVADVQIAVGLRGKTGMNGHALELSAGGDVLFNKSMNKVPALGYFLLRGLDLVSHGCQSFLCKYLAWNCIIQNPWKNCKENQ